MNFDKRTIRNPWLFARLLMKRLRDDLLLRNSIYIMGTNVVIALFGYLFWIVATHTYSTYDVGLGSALISVLTLASSLATLGIGPTLVQVLPRRGTDYSWSLTLNAGFTTGILAGLLSGAIVVVALPLFGSQFAIVEHDAGYALAFVVGVPLMTVSLLLDQTFIAERAANNMLLRNLSIAMLKIPLLIVPVVLITHVGALGILLPGVMATAVILIMAILLLVPRLKRVYCLAARGLGGQIRSMLSSIAGNQFIILGGLLPYYLLPVLVASRLSPADNAYYYTTLRLAEFFTMGSFAVSMSLLAEGSHESENLSRKVRSSAAIIGMIIGPAMLVCFLGGRYILLVFGPSYARHGLVLFMIFVAATIPDAITNIYLTVLRIQNRLAFAALLNISMGTLNLILAWMLLPELGIAGAGWAFLIAQVAGSLAAGLDVIRVHRHHLSISRTPTRNDSGNTEMEKSYVPLQELSEGG